MILVAHITTGLKRQKVASTSILTEFVYSQSKYALGQDLEPSRNVYF